MKRYVFAAITFCLVIGFQNCAQNKLSDSTGANAFGNPTEVTPAEKMDVSQTETVEVPESSYLEAQLQPAIAQSKPTSTFASHHLEIDAKTGVIHVYDQNEDLVAGVQYCLNSQDLEDLKGILATAKICDGTASADDQVNCSMDYTYPYAKLLFVNAEVSLGESTSGCSKGPDLCGQQKDMLQSFLANLQTNLSSKTCDFQVVSQ